MPHRQIPETRQANFLLPARACKFHRRQPEVIWAHPPASRPRTLYAPLGPFANQMGKSTNLSTAFTPSASQNSVMPVATQNP